METVEVVIKLPKEIYEAIQQVDRIILGRRNGKTIEFELWNGVKNGIPLPKRHGELIDSSKLGLTDFEIVMCDGDYRKGLEMLCNKIENAKVLIEADKED